MKIVSYLVNSFVDYDGFISYVVFTPRCNMRCWYCHNMELMNSNNYLNTEEIVEDINSRVGFIDAVVITGGEPTLQSELISFLEKIKKLGLLTKLDTNGTNSSMIKTLIDKGLLDYVAMDIKAPIEKYSNITMVKDNVAEINKSIRLLIDSNIEYEFRTTFAPNLTVNDIEIISKNIAGAKRYFLQQYTKINNIEPHKKQTILDARNVASKYVKTEIRNI